MRVPCDEGLSPSPAIRIPALTSAALNLPMSTNNWLSSGEGFMPCSLSSVAFTKTITRISVLLARSPLSWPLNDEQDLRHSTS